MTSLGEFVSNLPCAVKWHGGFDENNRQMTVNAGQLSMLYQSGNLRYVSINNQELVRMIYPAVRDKEWLTVIPEITGEKIDIKPDSFSIQLSAHFISERINFLAHYLITGKSDNSLVFLFEGEALADFEKNRIGFCILHPAEGNKGEECTIIHSNNNEENLVFPFYISPQQPFYDIKSMRWKRLEISCEIDFSGEIFETEDQRNWTDASFKTYCTPLNQPFPVKIHKGERISQKIELKVNTVNLEDTNHMDKICISVIKGKMLPFPQTGVGQSGRLKPMTAWEKEIVKDLRFDHYRIDLYLFNDDWQTKAGLAFKEAAALGYRTELVLFFDEGFRRQAERFIKWITSESLYPVIIILFHKDTSVTPGFLADEIIPLIKAALPGIKTGIGTNANFAQLNRNKPDSIVADFICYSIHPQEHASDNLTLIENLQPQEDSVESAGKFTEGRGIWVSPVNLQRRFNANVANYETPVTDGSYPPQTDPRIMSMLGASWTAISLKYLSQAGAAGITYFETVGERGIIQGDYAPAWPELFRTKAGMIFPVYHVFRFVLQNRSSFVVECTSSSPLCADMFCTSDGSKVKAVLVNFSSCIKDVVIKGLSGEFTLKQINEVSFTDATIDHLWLDKVDCTRILSGENICLEPFSVNFIEGRL